jgi:putative phage-type endonuclease
VNEQEAKAQWQQERRTGIGGSDAAAVLGLSPWKTDFDVWLEKRGEAPRQNPTEAMWWGTALEELVARRYSEATGHKLYNPQTIFRHHQHQQLLATPDRIALIPSKRNRGLEVKTASIYGADEWGAEGTDEIPQHYLVQCVHYMMVTDYQQWDVAVLIGGSDFRVYTVKRDLELEGQVRERLLNWWQKHIEEGVQPPMRGSTVDSWIKQRFPREQLEATFAGSEADVWAHKLLQVRQRLKLAELDEEEAKNNLKMAIGDRAGLIGGDWKATWKLAKDSTRVDWEAVARELANDLALHSFTGGADKILADAAASHSTVTPGSRRLLLKAVPLP